MNDRINEIKNLLADDRDDSFLHYALGLEYIKAGETELALERFEILLNKHPDYLPVYYQAAHLYVENNDKENIFVFMHKPFWADGIAKNQSDAFHEIFKANNVDAVFTGNSIHIRLLIDPYARWPTIAV